MTEWCILQVRQHGFVPNARVLRIEDIYRQDDELDEAGQRFFILIKASDALLELLCNLRAVLADRIHPRHSVAVSGCASEDSSDFSRFAKIFSASSFQ